MADAPDLFKTLVWDNLVKAAIQRLFVAAPFLAWGPIGFVVSGILTMLADKFYEIVKLEIELQLIILRNEKFRAAFNDASVKLKVIGSSKGFESPEFEAARVEHAKALSEFVRFNVARA